MVNRLFSFIGGGSGPWRVTHMTTIAGAPLPAVPRLDIARTASDTGHGWILKGVTSNERYVTRDEKQTLVATQQGLGRQQATHAALIPIRKSDAWWALTQEERRDIFETTSRHIQIGMDYLPAIARKLHHCRDMGTDEPFDFLTWFEFAPEDEDAFGRLLQQLRATHEWSYVEREIDIRLVRV